MEAKGYSSEKRLQIRRGRVDSVDLYEVKENELEILENGEPTGIYLNFSIFLYSLSFSSILALCTATFSNSFIQNAFIFTSIIGILGGTLLIILWWRGRKSIRLIIKTIKDRIPPEFIKEEFQSEEHLDINITNDNNKNSPAG